MSGRVLVIGTDPHDVEVREAVVVVPGPAAGRRADRLGGLAVIAEPGALPFGDGVATVVRADGLFGSPPSAMAAPRVAELLRVSAAGAVIVTAAQVDPGPAVAACPVDASSLRAMLPAEAEVTPFHDRVCRKDWHRFAATVPER